MASGRPMAVLEVSDAEHRELEALARRRKTVQALALRARIVLHCAEGLTNTEVATRLDVARPTVGKWRNGLSGIASTACMTSRVRELRDPSPTTTLPKW